MRDGSSAGRQLWVAPDSLRVAYAQVGASDGATFTRESEGPVLGVVLRHVADRDVPALGCRSMAGCL